MNQYTITPKQMEEAVNNGFQVMVMINGQYMEYKPVDPAAEILIDLEKDQDEWKHEWLKDVCKLCLEYLTLDGLEDAFRATQIHEKILDIAEKELNG